MKIAAVEAVRFRLPMAQVIALSTGTRSEEEHVLVTLRTDDGVVGHSECVPRPSIYGETPAGAAALIGGELAVLVEGLPVSANAAIARALAKVAGNPAARSAVELAAFDAHAKSLGAPAHRLLGGGASETRCCAMLGYGEPAAVVAEAREQIERFGVGTIKFKVGPDLEQDIRVARALREELGEGVRLYPDANRRYTTAEAIAFVDATRECRLRWLEEISDPDDLAGRRAVVARAACTVLGDESCATPRAAAVELEDGRVGGVSIKPARTAIAASTRIRELCAARGAPAVVGSQGDSAIGALVSAAFAAAAPPTSAEAAEILFFTGLADDLLTARPTVTGGAMKLSDAPGFGIEIDPERLARYQVTD
jgi:L-alanine-DL-glutamate epimerase-like enolase superfamily enzyme